MKKNENTIKIFEILNTKVQKIIYEDLATQFDATEENIFSTCLSLITIALSHVPPEMDKTKAMVAINYLIEQFLDDALFETSEDHVKSEDDKINVIEDKNKLVN